MRGGFLYEHLPSLFPEGEFTEVELALWELYYHELKQAEK
jgi:hypothetical protein